MKYITCIGCLSLDNWTSISEYREVVLSSGATRSSRTTSEIASHSRQLEFLSKIV